MAIIFATFSVLLLCFVVVVVVVVVDCRKVGDVVVTGCEWLS